MSWRYGTAGVSCGSGPASQPAAAEVNAWMWCCVAKELETKWEKWLRTLVLEVEVD